MRISTVTMQQQGVNAILDKQVKLTNTELQLATGRRILRPSDDPANSSLILNLKESIGISEQHIRNADMALTSLSFSESSTEGIVNNLQRARELTVQGLNDTNTPENRQALAMELRQIRAAIVNLANSQDAQGEYIYGGSKVSTAPFTATGGDAKTGNVSYGGNSNQKPVQIGVGQKLYVRDAGTEVFGSFGESFTFGATVATQDIAIHTTNNTTPFTVDLDAGMTVDQVVSKINAASGNSGNVVASKDADGKLHVTSADGSDVVVADSGDAGGAASLGITLSSGAYTIKSENLFNTLDHIADQLESGAITDNALLTQLDTGMNRVLKVQSKIGARINMIERHTDVERSFIVKMKETLANVNDLDYAETIAQFNLDRIGMEAAQQAYLKIQGLSLFDHMR